jgi:hypothetical protein
MDDLAVNHGTILRARKKTRAVLAEELKSNFHCNVPLVVHWDGELMPIFASGKNVCKLLTIAKLPSGTGEA